LASIEMPSRLFTYYATRELMNTIESDSGVDNRSLLKSLARFGWCDESLWPYNPNRFRDRPPTAAYEQAATRKIVQYLSVPQTLTQMKGCLAGGDPFIFGFTVYESLMSDTVERTGVVPMPRQYEVAVGGHDVLIVGYNDATRHFKFRNSWGQWGQNNAGCGFIPYEYAANPQLASDFWTVRHSAIPTPTPEPVPVPIPTPVPTPVPGGRIVQTIDLAASHVDLRYPAGWTGTATKE
jgi:C1A family cysteine protease